MNNVRKLLDLSTRHMTQRDSEILNDADHPQCWPGMRGEYGNLLWVPEQQLMEDQQWYFLEHGLSDALWQAIEYARAMNCDYILFDADAPTSENLPEFDW